MGASRLPPIRRRSARQLVRRFRLQLPPLRAQPAAPGPPPLRPIPASEARRVVKETPPLRALQRGKVPPRPAAEWLGVTPSGPPRAPAPPESDRAPGARVQEEGFQYSAVLPGEEPIRPRSVRPPLAVLRVAPELPRTPPRSRHSRGVPRAARLGRPARIRCRMGDRSEPMGLSPGYRRDWTPSSELRFPTGAKFPQVTSPPFVGPESKPRQLLLPWDPTRAQVVELPRPRKSLPREPTERSARPRPGKGSPALPRWTEAVDEVRGDLWNLQSLEHRRAKGAIPPASVPRGGRSRVRSRGGRRPSRTGRSDMPPPTANRLPRRPPV